jgi:hypothetical protein
MKLKGRDRKLRENWLVNLNWGVDDLENPAVRQHLVASSISKACLGVIDFLTRRTSQLTVYKR